MPQQHDYSAKAMFWRLLNAVLVLAMVLALIGIGTMIRYGNAIVSARTITVSGEGKTQITPDIATYSFSVVTQGADPAKIQQQNAQKMNDAIAFVKNAGVKPVDIQSTGSNLYPRYSYSKDSGQQKIDGYEFTQTATIKIRDLLKVGTIMTGLVNAGVNQMGSLQYSIENPEMQRAVARQRAFNDAYAKARDMAAQNGVRITHVVTFSESMGYGGPVFYDKAVMMSAGAPAPIMPTTEPGTQETTVTVSVTYEIR